MASNIVFVKSSASTVVDGKPIRLVKDEAWDGDDPVVAARPDLFNDLPERLRTSVEISSAPRQESVPVRDVIDLATVAEQLGVKVNKRWSESRLLKEISAAQAVLDAEADAAAQAVLDAEADDAADDEATTAPGD